MEISIIGGGPAGCYAGYLLAKSGHKVSIFEKKSKIGEPIQCTGLLTSDFDQFNLPMKSFLVNQFNNIEINSPNGKTAVIKQKEYLICREKFDNYLADLAKKAGAKIFLNHSFVRKERKNIVVKNKNGEFGLDSDIIIAADGPLSPTAKAFGFYQEDRKNYFGIQAIVEGNFDAAAYQTFFGCNVCPDLFAWIVPESPTRARAGLAATKDAKFFFDKFIRKHDFEIKEMQAGVIPLFNSKQKLKKGNCYLLGDAAGFVKATTLGGIIPGLKQAEILAGCINNGNDYEQEIKPLVRKLKLHLSLRKAFNRFSDQDWDRLISYISQPKIQEVFEKYTRDNPVPLALNSLLKEPRLLYFVKYLV